MTDTERFDVWAVFPSGEPIWCGYFHGLRLKVAGRSYILGEPHKELLCDVEPTKSYTGSYRMSHIRIPRRRRR